MTSGNWLQRLGAHKDLNFLFTNRIPRKALTHFVGWLSKVHHPWVLKPALWLWRLFTDLDLSEARHTDFRSLHECFTRELRPGARPIDAREDIIASPCDAIVGACGSLEGVDLIQAKGFPYTLVELLGDAGWAERYRDGSYVTLRLTSAMYHRFHAPYDLCVTEVNYISGDVWNVNPIALQRIERLFCKNERAVIKCALPNGQAITLVPVAAVLVAASACTGSTYCCTCVIAVQISSHAARPFGKARKWAGSSMARPSLCSHPRGLPCVIRF